jgi:arginyl-tRNA synthetase
MNIFQYFESEFTSILADLVGQGLLPENLDAARVVFELPRDASHGDLATNAAMILAKPAQKSPRDLAALFAAEFAKIDGVTGVEIAGPGFVNLRVLPILWARPIADIIKADTQYGRSQIGAGAHVNVEFVSANPTGPLHAAHARGAGCDPRILH